MLYTVQVDSPSCCKSIDRIFVDMLEGISTHVL